MSSGSAANDMEKLVRGDARCFAQQALAHMAARERTQHAIATIVMGAGEAGASYCMGAAVLAHSLRKHSSAHLVLLAVSSCVGLCFLDRFAGPLEMLAHVTHCHTDTRC